MERDKYNKNIGHGKWKVGDTCWCKCCCGPEFKILDLTFGYAILNHLPPVAYLLDELFDSEEELLKEKLKDLLREKERIDTEIKEEEKKLFQIHGKANEK